MVSLAQAVSELDRLIPNNGKITYVIVNLNANGANKVADMQLSGKVAISMFVVSSI
jgi:hypothetical protein